MTRLTALLAASLTLAVSGCHEDPNESAPKTMASSTTLAQKSASSASASAAPAPPMPSALAPDDPCLESCTKVAKELGCLHGDECAEKCLTLRHATACKKPVQKFIDCFTKLETKFWHCDDRSVPTLDTACEPEQNGITECMKANKGRL